MPPFVTTIAKERVAKLQADLLEQGFQLTNPAHTLFQAQKPGISCTVYTSLKLVVQGSDIGHFLEFYLEPEILEATPYTYAPASLDLTPRIGIDEAGKGDFFGPLCVAGVFAEGAMIQQLQTLGVKDSKSLNDTTIVRLSRDIKALCPHHVLQIGPERYNELYASFGNLNALLAWGHATCIEQLVKTTNCQAVIVDQFARDHVVLSAVQRKQLQVTLTQKHRAEADPVVAAASILARSAFVQAIERMSAQYGIEIPKGAARQVITAGKALLRTYGRDILRQTTKQHFRTTQQVLPCAEPS